MKLLSGFLKWVGYAVFAIAGIWEAILVLPPLYGWLASYVGYLAAPALLVVFPPIAAFAPFVYAFRGWWTPLLVGYGGAAIAASLIGLGALASRDDSA